MVALSLSVLSESERDRLQKELEKAVTKINSLRTRKPLKERELLLILFPILLNKKRGKPEIESDGFKGIGEER